MTYSTEFVGNYTKERHASPSVLACLFTHVEPNRHDRGIDLGCGTGNYTVPFIDKMEYVEGVDRCEQMIEVARARSKRARWTVSDLRTCVFQPLAYNKAWAVQAIHHLRQDQQSLFGRVFEALAPQGRFVAYTQFAEQFESMWLQLYFPSLSIGWEDKYQRTTTLRRWLVDAGFVNVRCIPFFITDTVEGFIRVGQRNPEVYLQRNIIRANPVGYELPKDEYESGMRRLREDTASGVIASVIRDFAARAAIPGEYGLLVADKP